MKLREGAYYRRRDGRIVGPARHDLALPPAPKGRMVFKVGGHSYNERGYFWINSEVETPNDLIEEVSAPVSELPAKRALRIGDRVRVYQGLYKETGKINRILPDGLLTIERDEGGEEIVHPKQCRRLVKREQRRVWVAPELGWSSIVSTAPVEGWTEFVEVKLKNAPTQEKKD